MSLPLCLLPSQLAGRRSTSKRCYRSGPKSRIVSRRRCRNKVVTRSDWNRTFAQCGDVEKRSENFRRHVCSLTELVNFNVILESINLEIYGSLQSLKWVWEVQIQIHCRTPKWLQNVIFVFDWKYRITWFAFEVIRCSIDIILGSIDHLIKR